MIEIIIPTEVPAEERIAKIPTPLVNCVHYISSNYPDRNNNTKERLFDRKFEELEPGAKVLYNPDRVVWEDDREYTLFLMRWSE